MQIACTGECGEGFVGGITHKVCPQIKRVIVVVHKFKI